MRVEGMPLHPACGSPVDSAGCGPVGDVDDSQRDGGGAGTRTRELCAQCGKALEGGGKCPSGHERPAATTEGGSIGGAAGTGPGWDRVARSVALGWRLLSRQPSVLWLALENAAIVGGWFLGWLAVVAIVGVIGSHNPAVGVPFGGGGLAGGAGLFSGFPRGSGGIPFYAGVPVVSAFLGRALMGGGLLLSLSVLWAAAGALALAPYAAGATIAGLIRALDTQVNAAAYWTDGFRFLGRSYLAYIATAILAVIPAVISALWSILVLQAGPFIGPILAILGNVTLWVAALPFITLVGAGVYQSGWEGFGQALTMVRRDWVLSAALVLVLSVVAALASWIASAFAPIPVLGWVLAAVLPSAAAVFCATGVLVYFRDARGIAMGSWAREERPVLPIPWSDAVPRGTHAADGEPSSTALAGRPPTEWSRVLTWVPKWGALLRRETQDAIPLFLGSPKEGFAPLASGIRADEALALPVDAFTVLGALLAGLGRPWWVWLVGGLVGFVFGVGLMRALAYGVRMLLQEVAGAVCVDDALRIVSLPFLWTASVAIADFVLALLTHSYFLVSALWLTAIVGATPLMVGALQSRNLTGWRSVATGVAVTTAVLLPWLLVRALLIRIQ